MNNEYYEARQHLNLSQRAYDIIESDKLDFMERPSFSGMLNLAFSAYCQDANANIETAVLRYRDALQCKLADLPDGCEKKQFISVLVESKKKELSAMINSYPCDCQFKVQLNRENYEYIMDWRDENNYYHSSAGKYIKTVIEEYASKNYFNREEIVLRNKLCLIQNLIDEGRLLSITSGRGNNAKHFLVKPYCLCTDKGSNFHYLVGLSKLRMSNDSEKPASFRISRITKIMPLSSHSGRITTTQKKQIDQRMKTVGVQFMLQEQELVRVRLSQKGRQQYERQTFLRPLCIEKNINEDGTGEYIFSCATTQIMFYFFKFGADAEILFPQELREKFCEKYKSAYVKYMGKESL